MADAPVFVFAIPLIARSAARDWDVVVHHFNATLGSIFNQTDPNFRVIVACTGRPEIRIPVDERLEFVDVPEPEFRPDDWEKVHADKAKRRAAVLERIQEEPGDKFFLLADADDLISSRLVAHVRESDNPFGFVITKGYAFDASRNVLGTLPFRTGRGISFHYFCGTSIVLRLTESDLRDRNEVSGYCRAVLTRGHGEIPKLSHASGRPLEIVPFRAVVYVRNHGNNMSDIREPEIMPERHARFDRRILEHRVPVDEATKAEFTLGSLLDGPPPRRSDLARQVSAPSLTVAVATCRRPEGLKRLLEALAPQLTSQPGRDLVVVNDGSHDDAYAEIVAAFAPGLRYEVLHQNMGVGATRNRAAALAQGEFVVFVDDDCVPPPSWLDWLEARLSAEPDLDVIAGTTRLRWQDRGFFERVQDHFQILPRPRCTPQEIILVTANVAIRRSLLEALGGFRALRIAEDYELSGRIAVSGARITADFDWYVQHDAEPFRAKLRKHWRYGFANGAFENETILPLSQSRFRQARRRHHLRQARFVFNRLLREAEDFSSSRFQRVSAALAATLFELAFHDGCAAARRTKAR